MPVFSPSEQHLEACNSPSLGSITSLLSDPHATSPSQLRLGTPSQPTPSTVKQRPPQQARYGREDRLEPQPPSHIPVETLGGQLADGILLSDFGSHSLPPIKYVIMF